jgi:hypothetical protein
MNITELGVLRVRVPLGAISAPIAQLDRAAGRAIGAARPFDNPANIP